MKVYSLSFMFYGSKQAMTMNSFHIDICESNLFWKSITIEWWLTLIPVMGFFSRYGAFAANSGLEQKTLCITLYTRFELEIEKENFWL